MRRVLLPEHICSRRPAAANVIRDFNGQTMGTSWCVRLAGEDYLANDDLQTGIQRQLDTIVSQMSHWYADSNLGQFNSAPAGSWHALPDAFFDVLSYALFVAGDSGGAYDPNVGALVNLWGFGPCNRHDDATFSPPSTDAVQSALARCGWQRVVLDAVSQRAYQPGGALIDLSAVAKGYAVDQTALYLEQTGIQHYLVEVGGELRGAGMKPDGQPWWVALEQPSDHANTELIVALHGLAVATSGDYRKFYLTNGKRYSHSVDPRAGYPIDNDIVSITVVHSDCMVADALSTALTVLGLEPGMAFAEQRKLAARFLVRDGERLVEHATTRFRHMMQ